IAQEAAARGTTREALVQQEISGKVTQPTDADVDAWFRSNQERLRGATLDQVRSGIRAYLVQERTQTARQAYIDRLQTRTSVNMTLQPPRQDVKAAERPARGPAK